MAKEILIKIKNNLHSLSCNANEENRLKKLGEIFKNKVEDLSSKISFADDKTLYLIAGLTFLDKLEEHNPNTLNGSETNHELIAIVDEVSNKIENILKKYKYYDNKQETQTDN